MMIEEMAPDFEHTDERGKLVQLVRNGYSQINVLFSKKGTFRGGHFHKENNEVFYVVYGKLKMNASDGTESKEFSFQSGDMFKVLPNVTHSFTYEEDTLCVALYDKGVEKSNGEMDIFREQAEKMEKNK